MLKAYKVCNSFLIVQKTEKVCKSAFSMREN